MTAQFDLGGETLRTLMQKKDFGWLAPPNPYWRLQPPTFLSRILKGGLGVKDYDARLTEVIAAVIQAQPGAYLTYAKDPTGLSGGWETVQLKAPSWKQAQTGALVRGLQANDACKAWIIPTDVDTAELASFLADGGWAIWKPAEKSKEPGVIPRILAQDCLKTVTDCNFTFLMTSWWDNDFTELAFHPELVQVATAA